MELSKNALSILTVGDGDFSCSLALKRAYQSRIKRLVATTLLANESILYETYPTSEPIVQELIKESCKISTTIYYGVDATQLHKHPQLITASFDWILFHHPHLGYEAVENGTDDSNKQNDQLAAMHSCLIAHYFYSARFLLRSTPFSCIHVCLSGRSFERWNVNEVVNRMELEYFPPPLAASKCLLSHYDQTIVDAKPAQEATRTICPPSSKSRRGHWLGRFGYRHQPTFPQSTTFQTNVSSSHHYFLRPQQNSTPKLHSNENDGKKDTNKTPPVFFCCEICHMTFDSEVDLEAHLSRPVLSVR